MKLWQYSLILMGAFLFFALILKLSKKKKPFRRAFLNMLLGNIVLVIVDLLSSYTGVYLPLSPLSITTASCAGVSGVAVMLVISCLM